MRKLMNLAIKHQIREDEITKEIYKEEKTTREFYLIPFECKYLFLKKK